MGRTVTLQTSPEGDSSVVEVAAYTVLWFDLVASDAMKRKVV